MASNDEGNITEQVGSRLDDLFGEGTVNDSDDAPLRVESTSGGIGHSSQAAVPPAPDGVFGRETQPADAKEARINKIDAEEIENSPIKELKSIVLSLEWEITDAVMEKLEEEIRKLEVLSQNDKIILAYLQLLGSLGKYIRQKLARAHVDSITLLHSVYESLEKAMLSKEMSEAAKKKILIAHVTQYKKLKQDIQSTKKLDPHGKPSASHRPGATVSHESETRPFPEYAAREIPSDFKDLTHMTQEILHSMREIQQTIQNEFAVLRGDIRRLLEGNK